MRFGGLNSGDKRLSGEAKLETSEPGVFGAHLQSRAGGDTQAVRAALGTRVKVATPLSLIMDGSLLAGWASSKWV